MAAAAVSLNAYSSAAFASKAGYDPFGLAGTDTTLLTACCLAAFWLAAQIAVHALLFARRKGKRRAPPKLFLYVALLCVAASAIFSFLLGTVAAVQYLAFLTGYTASPANFTAYGAYYYLIPRVVKETFKLPFMVLIVAGALRACGGNLESLARLAATR